MQNSRITRFCSSLSDILGQLTFALLAMRRRAEDVRVVALFSRAQYTLRDVDGSKFDVHVLL